MMIGMCTCLKLLLQTSLKSLIFLFDQSLVVYFRYWLYAAAKLKCLLVTNDEMRDHIFELLSTSFFQKWKQRHQVTTISSYMLS